MAGYITLCKYTSKGIGAIKEAGARLAQDREVMKGMGIRLVGVWLTMGEYDVVFICDAPDDQTMAAYLLQLGQRGDLSTQTLRAFGEDESAKIIGRLP